MKIKQPVSPELKGLTMISVEPAFGEVPESESEGSDIERNLGFNDRQG
jgi:hypothetical protein